MQVSIREFSISIMKNIPQDKTNVMECGKKSKGNQGQSVDKEQYAMGKDVHKCIGFRNFLHAQD